MRELNPDQLRTLTEVVELGSFTAAARRLNLSQPAVSLQIRQLEERLGVQLVERLGKRAFATAPGRELLGHARRMMIESEAALAAMRRYRERWLGHIRLGAGPSVVAYLLPPVLRTLRSDHPDIELSIRTGTTRDLASLIVRNEIDLAVVTMPLEDKLLMATPFRADPFFAVLPASERDVPDEISPDFFANRSLILDGVSQADRSFREWLRAGGVEPKAAMEIGDPEAIRNVVAAGLGVSVMPAEAIGGEVRAGGILARPLRPALVRCTALVQRRDKSDEPALRIVRERVMTLVKPGEDAAQGPT